MTIRAGFIWVALFGLAIAGAYLLLLEGSWLGWFGIGLALIGFIALRREDTHEGP